MKARLFSHTTPLALALQGGGAHGAFTWGILDRLLEDDRLQIAAISGTSAGAMNAVALAHGMAAGGRDGARAALQQFWRAVGSKVPFEPFTIGHADTLGFGLAARAWRHWLRLLSPSQLNPLGIDPLREILAEQIDFERLRASNLVRLFIAATHANSGRLRLFENAELDIDAVLASACLPTLQPAVMIDGEPYWDGGYSGNPAIWPLIYNTPSLDVLLVKINPLEREGLPDTPAEIADRVNEITFNAGLVGEMRAIAFVTRLVEQGHLDPGRYRALRLHMVADEAGLAPLSASSKLNTDRAFLEALHALGHAAADRWLAEHRGAIGRRGTLDLRGSFLDPRRAR